MQKIWGVLSRALVLTGLVGLFSGNLASAADPAATAKKLSLTTSMVTRVSPAEGDPTLLVDEQTLAGDPLAGTGGKPITSWRPIYGGKKLRAQIDLGKKYVIQSIYLYDANGNTGESRYLVDSVDGTTKKNLISDELKAYLQWKRFDVNTTTQLLEVETPGYVGMPEIVIYGYPAAPTNVAPDLNLIADVAMDAGQTQVVALKATDADAGDTITLSTVGTRPAFATFSQTGNGLGAITLKPTDSQAGSYLITVQAKDKAGLTAQRTFAVAVKAVGGPPPVAGVLTPRYLGTVPGTVHGFLEYLPGDYNTASRTDYPIVIFFHGLGERGNGLKDPTLNADGSIKSPALDKAGAHGPAKLIKNGKQFDAIVLVPQRSTSSTQWSATLTTDFVNFALARYASRIDLKRVYITGLSMGGGGTWLYGKTNPSVPAAMVPICGPNSAAGHEVLRGMPLWAFHHEVDGTVPYGNTTGKLKVITGVDPEKTRPQDNNPKHYTAGFDGVKWNWRVGTDAPPANENPILTTYEGKSHDAWTKTYDNAKMWEWLFKQTN